mgnify:CR=1 FL=1
MSHSSESFAFVGFAVVAGGFLLLAAVVVSSALVASQGRKVQWGKVLLGGLGLLLLLPAVLIVFAFVARSTPRPYVYVQSSQVSAVRAVTVPHNHALPQDEPGHRSHDIQRLDAPRDAEHGSSGDSGTGPSTRIVAEALPETPAESESEESAEAPAPDWVNEKEMVSDGRRLVVLSSKRYATVEEAEEKIREQARGELERDLRSTYRYSGSPPISREHVDRALGRRHVQQFTVKTDSSTFPVYVVHRQLSIDPALRETLAKGWREQIGGRQLWILSIIAGFLTLIFGTLAAYFRLDTRTKSTYRGRLRFAAVCVIAAGGVVAA